MDREGAAVTCDGMEMEITSVGVVMSAPITTFTSSNKICSKKVYMSKTYQARLSNYVTYSSLTRTNKENNLHKLTDSLNTYV